MTEWIEYKYRNHRSCYKDENGRGIYEYIRPIKKPDDLVFSIYHTHKSQQPKPKMMYFDFAVQFERTLDRIGFGEREDNSRRRKITFHSFRRWVKSTISDLGYGDYSEWFIGHEASTYWRQKESKKAELFSRIEHYLTYLDHTILEARGADIQTKLEDREKEIHLLRHRDSVNTDAIQNLSDQLMEVMAEVQELKKR